MLHSTENNIPREETDKLQNELRLLKQQVSWYKNIIDNTSFLIIIFDREGTILHTNNAWNKNFNQDIKRKPSSFLSILHPDDRTHTTDVINKIQVSGHHLDLVMRIKAGENYRTVRANLYHNTHLQTVYCEANDITIDQNIEEALCESESKYEEIFNASNDAVFIHDAETGTILDVNTKMLKMYGWEKKDVLNNARINDFCSNIPPYTGSEARKHLNKAVTNGPQLFEWQSKRKNNQLFWTEISLKYFKFNNNGRIIAVIRDLNKRKEVEAALLESEKMYKTLINTIPDMVFACDRNRKIIFVSQTTINLLGYKNTDELLGKDIFDFTDPGDNEYNTLMYNDLFKYSNISKFETKIIRKDKSPMLVEVYGTAIDETDDSKKRIIISIRDITDRKHFEQALLRETIFSDSVINSLPGLFYVIDENMHFIRWNKNVETITNYDPYEIEQMTPLDFFNKTDRSLLNQGFIDARESGESITEATLITKQNKKMRFLFTAIKMQIEHQKYLIGMALNIDQQKKIETQLRNSEQKYRQIFETIRDTYFELSINGTILEITPSVEEISHYSRDELLGGTINELYLDNLNSKDILKSVLDKKRIRDVEIQTNDQKNNVHYCSLNAELVTNQWGEPIKIAGTIRDITESRQLKEQLQHAQKMEAIGTLAGGIAHDFNNLLTAIIGGADLALINLNDTNEIAQLMHDIRDSGVRASNLIKQLLAFSRKQVLKKEIVDVNDILNDLKKLLHRLIREDIILNMQLSESNSVIQADTNQIEQVLINLVINATDAMPFGGVITIATEDCAINNINLVRNTNIKPGNYVKLTIQDSGTGMDDDTLNKIFDPFFTTKEVGKGTGLGLAMVYGIIKQHNGYIFASSTLHEGTTFVIYLPTAGKKPADNQVPQISTGSYKKGQETILVVEDEEMVQKLVCTTLTKSGYTVLKAEDVYDAINKAEQHTNDIHLMITDIIMPDMNGPELQKQIIQFCPDIKTIYMSGYSHDIIFENEIPDDNFNFIQKPFRMNDLIILVQEILAGR